MKKFYKYIFIVLIIILVIIFLVPFSNNKLKYNGGRDTIELLGDGTYQIYKHEDRSLGLSNEDTILVIENNVYEYSINDKKNIVYIFGKRGYTILNYEDNSLKQYLFTEVINGFDWSYDKKYIENYYKDNFILLDSFSQFTEEEQQILKALK